MTSNKFIILLCCFLLCAKEIYRDSLAEDNICISNECLGICINKLEYHPVYNVIMICGGTYHRKEECIELKNGTCGWNSTKSIVPIIHNHATQNATGN